MPNGLVGSLIAAIFDMKFQYEILLCWPLHSECEGPATHCPATPRTRCIRAAQVAMRRGRSTRALADPLTTIVAAARRPNPAKRPKPLPPLECSFPPLK